MVLCSMKKAVNEKVVYLYQLNLSRICNIFILITACLKLEACVLTPWKIVYWPDPRSIDMGSPANFLRTHPLKDKTQEE